MTEKPCADWRSDADAAKDCSLWGAAMGCVIPPTCVICGVGPCKRRLNRFMPYMPPRQAGVVTSHDRATAALRRADEYVAAADEIARMNDIGKLAARVDELEIACQYARATLDYVIGDIQKILERTDALAARVARIEAMNPEDDGR